MTEKKTYKSAGVDVDAGNTFVSSIGKLVAETHRPEVIDSIGGFGGLFQPDFSGMKQPVLVSSVDGVGTKLKVAFKAKVYDTVGQDLVNHCVNDIAVCGAEPLFFLDYFSTGRLEQHVGYDVVKGFSIACRQNGCALIGGETAEMPDIYADGEFDLAGTVVGVVDREHILDGSKTQKGDVILGITGTGLHTNGYSLARKVLFEHFDIHDHVDELGMSVSESLLRVHPSYLDVIRNLKSKVGIRGFAHITGGGIAGNTNRIVPEGLKPDIAWNSWKWPPIFKLIQRLGKVPDEDMKQAFNLGVGLTVIVSPDTAKQLIDDHPVKEFDLFEIGYVT
ncbi:phosphoribosylformylglycinamidine cyclo-ligase [Natronogracilivirga saccharolytica]|uniref:Phosphoribosylformylglycinamidine cyclo-ligase n=1 Tax=Natronogracilivirga saccharolytica TaxID=2812953 RepID=A0A8J7UTQ7_9BACT|nr:phosphoribosylformylglycinamidine cyclo-ligase [Natronogracilivirga saccharolytica]MBP3191600.1 phosphoribosylformylglycinamidine cyclo-ligase [Natronogracilivirga saccharolytica]